MGDGITIANIDGAVGENGPKQGSDDAVGLIRPPHERIANAEDDERVDLRRRHGRAGGRSELQDGSVAPRRHRGGQQKRCRRGTAAKRRRSGGREKEKQLGETTAGFRVFRQTSDP